MNDMVTNQFHIFTVSFVHGFYLMAAYTLLISIFECMESKKNRIIKTSLKLILALAYQIFMLVDILRLMYEQDKGEIRSFWILAVLLGMAFFQKTLGEWLGKIFNVIINKIVNTFQKILKIICKPIKMVFKFTKTKFGDKYEKKSKRVRLSGSKQRHSKSKCKKKKKK